jgi:hypothetical protein
MSNSKKITDAKNKEIKEMTHEERAIQEFIAHHYSIADLIDNEDDYNIPVTIRLNKQKVAMLDHLVEMWRSNRSNLAAELLEEMTWLVFKGVYKGKTPEELSQLHEKIYSEFEEKRKKTKPGKVKKGDK